MWHSNDKYRKAVWQCNDKYKEQKCCTPHLTEEQIKNLFIKALNDLLFKRKDIISEYNDIINIQLNTNELEEKQANIESEITKLKLEIDSINKTDNISSPNAEEYKERRNQIVNRYEIMKNISIELEEEINDKKIRRETIKQFRNEFEKMDYVTEFDNLIWTSMLEKMIVYNSEKIIFVFRDESEVIAAL